MKFLSWFVGIVLSLAFSPTYGQTPTPVLGQNAAPATSITGQGVAPLPNTPGRTTALPPSPPPPAIPNNHDFAGFSQALDQRFREHEKRIGEEIKKRDEVLSDDMQDFKKAWMAARVENERLASKNVAQKNVLESFNVGATASLQLAGLLIALVVGSGLLGGWQVLGYLRIQLTTYLEGQVQARNKEFETGFREEHEKLKQSFREEKDTLDQNFRKQQEEIKLRFHGEQEQYRQRFDIEVAKIRDSLNERHMTIRDDLAKQKADSQSQLANLCDDLKKNLHNEMSQMTTEAKVRIYDHCSFTFYEHYSTLSPNVPIQAELQKHFFNVAFAFSRQAFAQLQTLRQELDPDHPNYVYFNVVKNSYAYFLTDRKLFGGVVKQADANTALEIALVLPDFAERLRAKNDAVRPWYKVMETYVRVLAVFGNEQQIMGAKDSLDRMLNEHSIPFAWREGKFKEFTSKKILNDLTQPTS